MVRNPRLHCLPPVPLSHWLHCLTHTFLTGYTAISKDVVNITKPVLLLTAARDPIGTPALAEGSTRPYATNLKVQEIDSGHFLMLEKANEVNKAMEAFFEI